MKSDFWKSEALYRALMGEVLERPRRPLLEGPPDPVPGAYLLFTAGPTGRHDPESASPGDKDVMTLYGRYATGEAPVYVGSSRSLRERWHSHCRSLEGVTNLSREDVWMLVVPSDSLGVALLHEYLLKQGLNTPWNTRALGGFGCHSPGRARVDGQRSCSPWDALHPGRWWARPPAPQDRGAAVAALVRHQASGVQALWSPIES